LFFFTHRGAQIRIQICIENGAALQLEILNFLNFNFLKIYEYALIVGRARARQMGLPEDWSIVEGWTTAEPPFFENSASETDSSSKKTVLGKKMPDEFLEQFPRRELPQHPTTALNIKKLQSLINKYSKNWMLDKKMKAAAAVDSLKKGAPAH
jgi:hypothetical protein